MSLRGHNGKIICQLCFEPFGKEDLADVEDEPGMKWDVCKGCDEADKEAARRKGLL